MLMLAFYTAFCMSIEATIVTTNDLPVRPAVEQVEGSPK
jgi:hypothetical protein